jgi:hypothetical protein
MGHSAMRASSTSSRLALAAADDLADPRRRHIHCRDRPASSFTRM